MKQLDEHGRRLLLLVLLLCLTFPPVLLFTLYSLSASLDGERRLDASYGRTLILAGQLEQERSEENALSSLVVISGDHQVAGRLGLTQERFDATLHALRGLVMDPTSRGALDQIDGLARGLRSVEAPALKLRLQGASTSQTDAFLRAHGEGRMGAMTVALRTFRNEAGARYAEQRLRYERRFTRVLWTLAAASLLALVLCGALIASVYRQLAQKSQLDAANAKLAEQERRLSRSRKDAVEMVAHDLKNPLMAIMFASESLVERPELSAIKGALAQAKVVQMAASTMRRLIFNVLDHAKIEAGGLALDIRHNDMTALASQIALQTAAAAESKHIQFRSGLPEDKCMLAFDESRIEQVMSNLLANAIKFTDSGGEVRFSVEERPDAVLITVRDTGPGIPEESRERIFDLYWQRDSAPSFSLGLGLPISKRIVEGHGGVITVESEVGQGSTFKVELPRTPDIS